MEELENLILNLIEYKSKPKIPLRLLNRVIMNYGKEVDRMGENQRDIYDKISRHLKTWNEEGIDEACRKL